MGATDRELGRWVRPDKARPGNVLKKPRGGGCSAGDCLSSKLKDKCQSVTQDG